MALPLLLLLAFTPASMAVTLYNGLQTTIFSSNLSTSCDAALNTSISCPENDIQLLTYGIQTVGKCMPTHRLSSHAKISKVGIRQC